MQENCPESDLASQDVTAAKEQEDVMSEGRAMDSESASVLWLRSSCFFFWCCGLFARKLRIAVEPVCSMMHQLYAQQGNYKVQGHRQIKSAEASQPSQPSSIPLKRILKRTQLSRCLFCMEGLVM